MKVFIYIPFQSYTFGRLLIAANDQKEAEQVIEHNYSLTDEPVEFEQVLEGVIAIGQPRILHNSVGCL